MRLVLAGQDITPYVDDLTVQVTSNLGQGAGVMSKTAGRATTAQFEAKMGPASLALGAGQFTAPPKRNLFTADESDMEGSFSGFTISGGTTVTQDASQAWQGSFSQKVVTDGTQDWQGTAFNPPGSFLLPNTTYTFSAYVYGNAGNPMLIEAKQAESPFTGYGGTGFTGISGWQRVSCQFTTPATPPAHFNIHVITNGAGGTGYATTFWTDGWQLEQSSVANPWVVGGTEGYGNSLVRQGELIIYDSNGKRVFGGFVTNLDDHTKKVVVKTQLKAVDYWAHFDRVTVTKTYDGVSDTAAIHDLMTTYAPQVDLSQVNFSVSNTTLVKQVFRGQSLLNVLTHITDITGFDIWVDAYNVLHYQAPSTEATAAFSISDHPDFLSSYGANITQHTLDDNSTINRVTFVGGSHPTTDFTQDISSQVHTGNTIFVLAYSPHESSDGKIHVYVNGVDQVVGYQLTTDALKSAGGSCDVLIDRSQATLTFNVAPTTGQSVTCLYRYQTPLVVVVTSQQSFAMFGQWFDGLITDQTVQDINTGLQRCRTVLAEQATGLESLTFQLYQPGLQAGQRILVQNGVRGINTVFRIQSVQTQGLGGGQFLYTVQAGAWNWNLADVLMAASQFSQQADQNFDELNVSITALELVSNAAVHDAWTLLTRTSGAYYARSAPVGDGHDAYPGLSTITS